MRGTCEFCGETSSTWLGDWEVCERCRRSAFEEARAALTEAVIVFAEDNGLSYEDAYEVMTDAVIDYSDLSCEKVVREEEDTILERLKAEPIDIKAELDLEARMSPSRLVTRISGLRKRGAEIKRLPGGIYTLETRERSEK